MRKIAVWILAFGIAASPAVFAADGPGNDKADKASDTATKKAAPDSTKPGSTKPDTTKTDAAKPAAKDATAPSSAELAAELDQLRALLKEQADQLELQRQELAAMKAGLAHDAATSPASPITAGAMSAVSIPSAATATPAAGTPVPAPAPQDAKDQHSPLFFKIGDAQFTPGGFMDLTAVFRTTGTGTGIGTGFNSIPFNNNLPIAATSETRFSVQNSRISLRADAPVGGGKISGYFEADFLGLIAANANVTSNSNSLRTRLYFADYRRGNWEILGGQDWSMLTPNRKGIGVFPGDIFFTQDMDTNYQIGLTWARQPQFRIMYHPNDSWTLGVSIENPDALLTGLVTTPAGFGPFAGQLDATGGGTLATPPTPNSFPDIIFKVANDHMFGEKLFHIEAAGLLSQFRIVTPTSIVGGTTTVSNRATGGGGSVNLNLEIFKNVHLIANSFFSDGGGRYIIGSGPDLIVKQLTTTSPFLPGLVHAYSGIGGIEYQATKNSFFDFYYGGAYYGRNVQVNPATGVRNIGYGFSGSSNSNNRIIDEYTVGWTQTFWSNPNYGKFQMISQGSYLSRAPWFVATGAPVNAHLFMVYMDLRYTLP